MQENSNEQLQLSRIRTASGFEFPPIYSFPPFFTQQPNVTTWNHQMKQWIDLILSYCKFHRTFDINLTIESTNLDLFNNIAIQRKLSLPTLKTILTEMISTGLAEYNNESLKSKAVNNSILIYWQRPEEWAQIIYEFIETNGLKNSILTFYELTVSGNLVETTLFYQLPMNLLKRALAVLEKSGKAQVFKSSADEDGQIGEGVKFL